MSMSARARAGSWKNQDALEHHHDVVADAARVVRPPMLRVVVHRLVNRVPLEQGVEVLDEQLARLNASG
jgi:hypothetical protein